MLPIKFALIAFYIRSIKLRARIEYFKFLGIQIGRSSTLGKIKCEWPKNIKIGSNCTIQDGIHFDIKNPFSGGNRIIIGDRVFIGHNSIFNCTSQITIGNNCLIACNTVFADISHLTNPDTNINEQDIISENIIVSEDVWIGIGCIILKGVTIGKGSIIGAGSLVNKSIPEYQLWAGSPARYIRNR